MINAGRLKKKISIQTSSKTTVTASGEPVMAWTTALNDIWARVEPLSGRELYSMNERYSEATTKFTIRYSTVITTPTMRINYNGEYYDIEAVVDPEDAHRELQFLARKMS